ncbi:MAG: hypothetical protein ACLFPE_08925 [Bacteroidales bacterium]
MPGIDRILSGRKLVVVLLLMTLLNTPELRGQDIPPPNPGLTINILSGPSVMFVFDEMDEYKDGISNAGQSTFIRIGSVSNWTLQFKADQPIFYGENNPTNQMELNNVGVMVVSTGTNLDDGTHITNYARNVPLALDESDVTLMTPGILSNKGYGISNAFTLNWEMGTMRGNMNNMSMLEQQLETDTYTLNIVLTLMAMP